MARKPAKTKAKSKAAAKKAKPKKTKAKPKPKKTTAKAKPNKTAAKPKATLAVDATLVLRKPIEIVVLSPEQHKGFVVEAVGIELAAHLFVLLEDVLVGDGRLDGPRIDPAVAAMARGERHCEGSFSIGWHYEYWFGVRPSAAAALTGLHHAVAAMIGVEAEVRQLPAVSQVVTILMRPKLLGARFCDAGFLRSELGGHASIRQQLDAAQTAERLRELDHEAGVLERGGA